MSEEEELRKVKELLEQFDPDVAAINTVAKQYAEPWLAPENLTKYAGESGLNALLSVPNLPRDVKKKIILGHLTAELNTAFSGVGDPRLPPAIAEIVAEEWCDKLPIDGSNGGDDWIAALNAMAGAPGYEPEPSKPSDNSVRQFPWAIVVWGALAIVGAGCLIVFVQ